MNEFTVTQKRYEAEREVAMRKRAYPNWVGKGKMNQDEAVRRIACMEAIAEDYRKLEQTEKLI